MACKAYKKGKQEGIKAAKKLADDMCNKMENIKQKDPEDFEAGFWDGITAFLNGE
jgi:hypothetical protein